MVTPRKQKKLIFLAALMFVFSVLISGVAVWAEGEESFFGVIETIEPSALTVRVTATQNPARTIDEAVTVFVPEEVKRARIRDNKTRNIIDFEKLSIGSLIEVSPLTLLHKEREVEANYIRLIGVK
jgi:hypothetical protein